MGFTTVIGTGTLVRDPDVRRLGDGTPMARFTIAANDRRFNKTTEVWEDVNTTFFNLTCWRMLAERVASDLRKGDHVFFSGKLQVKRFQKSDGTWDSACDVDADLIGPDLRRNSVDVKRKRREVPPAEPEPAAATADPWTTATRESEQVSEPAA